MYDFHLHSSVSFDSEGDARQMAQKAAALGLREICFTDHLDYDPAPNAPIQTFTTEEYNAAYDGLEIPGLKIYKGFEFGMLPDNQNVLQLDLQRRHFDFVIGSVHFVDGLDIFLDDYWQGRTWQTCEYRYLEFLLDCVQGHDGYDVVGHINGICKARANPNRRAVKHSEYAEVFDEILRSIADKGKGIEVNTSGFDRCGAFLPSPDYLRRFKELGGTIVTVGSDAHTPDRVGQYCAEACAQIVDIFGYICTFADRKPIFHKP